MNHRISISAFAKHVFAAALGVALLFTGIEAAAQKIPVEGTDFRVVRPPQPVEPNKIEVIEFFWYGCPHCNVLEPALGDWIKRRGPDVVVRRVPVAFSEAWAPHQRLYYALEALGKEPELRAKVFHAIHSEGNFLNTPELMATFAAKNGIDRQKFLDTYNSFAIMAKAQRANQLAEAYGVDSVPTVGVAGKYSLNVTPASIGNIDYFVLKERALMKPVAAETSAAPKASRTAPAQATAPKQTDKKAADKK